MAGGFLGWRAGLLVAGLTAFSYILLGTVRPRLSASPGLRSALRALRSGGYRVIPDGAARYVAVGPAGVYVLVDTRRRAEPAGSRDWRIGGAPAERLAARLTAHTARLDRVLASGPDTAGGEPPATVAVAVVAGPRPETVTDLGRMLLARPRAAVRHILAQQQELPAAEADRAAAKIERHLS